MSPSEPPDPEPVHSAVATGPRPATLRAGISAVLVSLFGLFSIACSVLTVVISLQLNRENHHGDAGLGPFFLWLLLGIPSFFAAFIAAAIGGGGDSGPPKTILVVAFGLVVLAYPTMIWLIPG